MTSSCKLGKGEKGWYIVNQWITAMNYEMFNIMKLSRYISTQFELSSKIFSKMVADASTVWGILFTSYHVLSSLRWSPISIKGRLVVSACEVQLCVHGILLKRKRLHRFSLVTHTCMSYRCHLQRQLNGVALLSKAMLSHHHSHPRMKFTP